jgi:hypothetical protein
MISFHPGALSSFSAAADELLREVRMYPNHAPAPDRAKRFDIQPAAVIRPEDMIGVPEMTAKEIDPSGNETGRFWESRGQRVGWTGDAFQKMRRLAGKIANSAELRGLVSEGFILDQVFSWLRETLEHKRTDSIGEFISQLCDSEIGEHEIWIPVYRTYSSTDLKIGEVELKSITRDLLDVWFTRPVSDPRIHEKLKQLEHATRIKHQGSVAACIKVRAQKQKAFELAIEKALVAIALLRFLSVANWSCTIKSYALPFGMQNAESWCSFEMTGGRIESYGTKAVDEGPDAWVVDPMIEQFPDIPGLLSDLAGPGKTEFHRTLFDAMLIYSRNSTTTDPASKLVFILVALESMLLKDSSEPIQGNLAERLAFIIGSTLEERRDIVTTVKKTYGMRSGFIHHGESPDDIELFERFLGHAWACMLELLRLRDKVTTRLELLAKLDDMKLS